MSSHSCLFLSFSILRVFLRERSHQDRLATTIASAVDPQHPFFLPEWFPRSPSRPCRHPSIRTLCERYSLGARWVFSFSRCCYLISVLSSHLFGGSRAPGLSRSHLDSAVELGCPDRNSLGHCSYRFLAIAQWFVHLSAYPQPMQQDRQLSRHGHHRSFLGIFSPSLCQLPSPSPQITVFPKRSQNVMRSLHHHRAQIPVSFFADSFLRFALPGVPPARFQSQKTADLATLQKPVWVFDRQDIRQRQASLHVRGERCS